MMASSGSDIDGNFVGKIAGQESTIVDKDPFLNS